MPNSWQKTRTKLLIYWFINIKTNLKESTAFKLQFNIQKVSNQASLTQPPLHFFSFNNNTSLQINLQFFSYLTTAVDKFTLINCN